MTQKLGFGESPETVHYLFVGTNDSLEVNKGWYLWDFNNNKPIQPEGDALTGIVHNIFIKTTTYKNEKSYKLNIRISADREYCIQTSVGTTFSRGVLLALNSLGQFEFSESALTFAVKPGDDGKVVFGSVFDPAGKKIFTEWDGTCSLFPIVNALQAKLGCTVQTMDMIDNPDKYRQNYTGKHEEQEEPEEAPKSKAAPKADKSGDIPF